MIFVLIPFMDVVRRSFTSALGGNFVGLQNYRTVLGNKAFLLAAGNTAKFLAVCMPLLLGLSLLVALILYGAPEKAGPFKTAFLIPMAVPVASVALLWQVLFDRHGLLNGWIVSLGGLPADWMQDMRAFWVLVGSYIWKNLGYDVVLWMAGLAGINPSLFEAARVDGAGSFTVFWRITLPNLLPSLYTILVLSLLNAFKVFREAYLVAGDYPADTIYLLQHLFNNWFRELSMDKLAAAAVLVAAAVLILILLLQRAWEEDA
ncbi:MULTISPECIES: carbohydrate ABC transporter permease [Anaerotruncus]|uniref:carbohydrate ABC transporter permease n=1 Tax=Anaerotruncus TaxID=244127 RepID=UPI00311AB2AF